MSATTAAAPIGQATELPSSGTPQRRCIVTGESLERGALLRFVVGPDGAIVPDVAGRLPGRGLWLTSRRDIVERAVAKRLFARAARRPVVMPPDLADRVESLLARRCGEALGLARRAGLAVAGFERTSEAVRRRRAALLLFALDGADGARDSLTALGGGLPRAEVLTGAELGAPFDRERIVHVAIAGGPLCQRLMRDMSRLAGMRQGAAVDTGRDRMPAGPATQDGGAEADD